MYAVTDFGALCLSLKNSFLRQYFPSYLSSQRLCSSDTLSYLKQCHLSVCHQSVVTVTEGCTLSKSECETANHSGWRKTEKMEKGRVKSDYQRRCLPSSWRRERTESSIYPKSTGNLQKAFSVITSRGTLLLHEKAWFYTNSWERDPFKWSGKHSMLH